MQRFSDHPGLNNLPPRHLLPPSIAALLDERDALTRRQAEARSALATLQAEHPRAVQADRMALAAALREGSPEPKVKAVEKLNGQIHAAEERSEAFTLAGRILDGEIDLAIRSHREDWLADATEAAIGERQSYIDAIEALIEARRAYMEASGVITWLRVYPAASYKATLGSVQLKGANGDRLGFEAVANGLRPDDVATTRPG